MNKETGNEPGNSNNNRLMPEFPIPGYEQWRAEVERLLKGASYEKRMLTATPESITLQPLYRSADCEGLPQIDSFPGCEPFLRGSNAPQKDSAGWDIAQAINYPAPAEFNEAVRDDLTRGLESVNLPLDFASRSGLDPDQAQSDLIGRGGVSISTLADLAKALDNVKLSEFPLSIEAGSAGLPFICMLNAFAENSRIVLDDLEGTVTSDPLGELIRSGRIPLSFDKAMDQLSVIIVWAEGNLKNFRTVRIHGEPYNNGGASAVQELAFTLATAVEYIRELEKRHIPIETAVNQFQFSFAAGGRFFMEVAKLRAFRVLWNNFLEACDVAEGNRKTHLVVHTSRYSKTACDPYVNMLRDTTEAFSAVVGGADSINVAPFDEEIRRADRLSRRIARNCQLILRDESHLEQITDPGGGSWYIESLTDQLAEKSWALLQDVERRGGMFEALKGNFPQDEIARVAESKAESFAFRKSVMVGINMFPDSSEKRLDPRTGQFQSSQSSLINNCTKYKKSSSYNIAELENKIASGKNDLITAITGAFSSGATLGQVCNILWKDADSPEEIIPIPIRRASEPFERLRRSVEKHRDEKEPLKVFLATVGPIAGYMPRFDFSASFFEIGGFEVVRTSGYDSPGEAVDQAIKANAAIVVICGLDNVYPEAVPAIAPKLKEKSPGITLVLAGLPPDENLKNVYQRAGINYFIHIKSNALQVLTEIASEKGVQL